jgi:hypothetical protein
MHVLKKIKLREGPRCPYDNPDLGLDPDCHKDYNKENFIKGH